MSRNLSALSYRKGLDHNLFEELGTLAPGSAGSDPGNGGKDLEQLAADFLVGTANVYGSTTFYDFLKPENQGKEVYVCNGSACLTAGTQPALEASLLKHVDATKIGYMCCLGRCHENAAFQFKGRNYSACGPKELEKIFSGSAREAASADTDKAGTATQAPAGPNDRYRVASIGVPVLTAAMPSLEEWYALWESLLESGDADAASAEIKASGLRGRGGAGFPMHIKLETCRNTEAAERFVVCNADEGDPGAYTDRYLLEQQPHAVLFGLMVAGWIARASTGVLYIRGEYPESIAIMRHALAELEQHGWLGENIRGSGFRFRIKIIAAQGAYICGEETALLASIEGQRPEVRVRPPFPATEGLFRLPTVVNNVETLASLHWILENGGKAFATLGRGRSTGTKLLSLDGHFQKPGVYEVPMGTPLQEVLYQLGGGFRHAVKAMHIGGPLGGLVPVSQANRLTVDFESFAEHGFLLGHGSVLCIPESFPLIEYLEHLFQFTAHESCGKCFPCRLGSVRGQELLHRARSAAAGTNGMHGETGAAPASAAPTSAGPTHATNGMPGAYATASEDPRIDRELFMDLLDTLEKGSLCALGGGLPLPVRNALEHFPRELAPYFSPALQPSTPQN
ncbi:MAG: formate dehydrogenase [Bacteroidetes bacterium]|nr:formate dehydrogenase [Bacteroidota bacterium]